MKTVLAVVGAIVVLGIVVVAGGGYYVYKKGTSAVVQVSEKEIDKFILTKHPPEPVANSLHRIVNGVKLHPSMYSSVLVATALNSIQDGIVTEDKTKMLAEAAQLAEQNEIPKEQITAFAKKYQAFMSRRNYPQQSQN